MYKTIHKLQINNLNINTLNILNFYNQFNYYLVNESEKYSNVNELENFLAKKLIMYFLNLQNLK